MGKGLDIIKSVMRQLPGGDAIADPLNVVNDVSGKSERDAAEAEARRQADAMRASAEKAAAAAQAAARQTAVQQEQAAARNAAEGRAKDATSKPMESADVQVSGPSTGESASAVARKRRQTFGVGSSSGVNI